MRRRRLLTAGLAGLLLAGCTTPGVRNSAGQITAPTTIDTFSIRVGDCVGKIETGSTTALRLIPCDQPHYWEAFALAELEGEEFPGNSKAADTADRLCRREFTDFVGVKVDDSTFELTSLIPTKETWTQTGDRQVTCLAGSTSGKITGSLRGAAK